MNPRKDEDDTLSLGENRAYCALFKMLSVCALIRAGEGGQPCFPSKRSVGSHCAWEILSFISP